MRVFRIQGYKNEREGEPIDVPGVAANCYEQPDVAKEITKLLQDQGLSNSDISSISAAPSTTRDPGSWDFWIFCY